MPEFQIPERRVEVSRKAMLLDTNVLVAAFDRDEENHADARYFIDEWDSQWLVPVAVVIETWGLLVGSRKKWRAGYEFLAWLNTPGTTVAVVPEQGKFDTEYTLVPALEIDCVDVMIVRLASTITLNCSLRPALPIATYDTSDFLRLFGTREFRFDLFDLRSFELQNLDG